MTAFVDTSFYIARIMPRDQWHEKALRAVRPDITFCTSTLVLNETISLLQARGFVSAAISFLREARLSHDVSIVYPDAVMQSEGWNLFARWGPAGANAIDCVSFAVMRKLSIRKAFTFDEHFRTAGFEILR
ncbi:MAG: PIN domain-containing protein [Bryobacteraceae bacterium]|jgi:predicted nucleic acid-binding protein